MLCKLVILAVLVANTTASRILALQSTPSRSHGILMERLIHELSKKGHHVTYLSVYPLINKQNPNIDLVKIDGVSEFFARAMDHGNESINWFEESDNSPWWIFPFAMLGPSMCEFIIDQPQVSKVFNSDQKYDLILSEIFMNEGLMAGLSHKFKAPIVAVQGFMPNLWPNYLTGNPSPSSYVADPNLAYSAEMTFFQRMYNFVFTLFFDIFHPLIYLPTQDQFLKKYFGEDTPCVKEIIKNTSLVLVNHHYALGFPRPNLPNVIDVAGMHIFPVKPLPSELQKEADKSKNGVILFSLGSNLKSSEMNPDTLKAIIKCFARQPYDIFWKFEAELKDLPSNVKISPWLPQSDILGHPKIKLFITHGGLLSTTEAVYRGVPVLGIPVFGDQPLNMKHTENAGLGKALQFKDVTENSLCDSITEVITNPRYNNAAKLKSQVLLGDMNSPIERAIYWVEYVIKYKGAPHLRSPAQNLAWYQLHQLDVIAFIAIALLILLKIEIKVFKYFISLLCGKKQVAKGKKNN